MDVVYTSQHLSHAPEFELQGGNRIPAWEVTDRAESIRAALESDAAFDLVEPTEHGLEPIAAVHDRAMIDYLERAWVDWARARRTGNAIIPDTIRHQAIEASHAAPPSSPLGQAGYWCFDVSTPILAGTVAAARAAVDVALTAADRVLAGAPIAYGLCRPPGHHAARAAFGGYCYFNNAAIAVEWLLGHGATNVSILDVDFHHGNGTQQLFYERPDVAYVSLHGDPNGAYPYYTGYADETGSGRGAGANLNLPLPPGTDDAAYLGALDRALDWLGRQPEGPLVVSLGLDTYRLDPQCDFALTTSAYRTIGARVGRLGRPLIVLQEGGYYVPALGENVRQWLLGAIDGSVERSSPG